MINCTTKDKNLKKQLAERRYIIYKGMTIRVAGDVSTVTWEAS